MGVNRVGFCITDEELCKEAACNEVVRRYLIAAVDFKKGLIDGEAFRRAKLLMDEVKRTTDSRSVVKAANDYAAYKRSLDEERYQNLVAMAIQLNDGRIITGRSSRHMVAGGALILNAIKTICGIPDEVALISPDVLETLQNLKTKILHKEKSTLNLEEILSALSKY